ncbi:MAG: hypothetical protein O8C64_09505 [Candidatus Methanoperedens sp.]|nr:hypothetical protein [Candidatus Methanoperedens sp.]MCZ7404898.1 hypothetical protein [Candidatus Methanoperedens sp.]
MKCKHANCNCMVRIITLAWEEIRACEHGVSCNYNNKQVLKA